jgi:hypothetical protein
LRAIHSFTDNVLVTIHGKSKTTVIMVYHLTFLWFIFNMVFLTTYVFLSTRFVNTNGTGILTGHVHWLLLTRLVRFHIFQEAWSAEFTYHVLWLVKTYFCSLHHIFLMKQHLILILFLLLTLLLLKYFSKHYLLRSNITYLVKQVTNVPCSINFGQSLWVLKENF